MNRWTLHGCYASWCYSFGGLFWVHFSVPVFPFSLIPSLFDPIVDFLQHLQLVRSKEVEKMNEQVDFMRMQGNWHLKNRKTGLAGKKFYAHFECSINCVVSDMVRNSMKWVRSVDHLHCIARFKWCTRKRDYNNVCVCAQYNRAHYGCAIVSARLPLVLVGYVFFLNANFFCIGYGFERVQESFSAASTIRKSWVGPNTKDTECFS